MTVKKFFKRLSISASKTSPHSTPPATPTSPASAGKEVHVNGIAPLENGEAKQRRFHEFKNVGYILPNDEEEQERLEIQHKFIKMLLGDKNYPDGTMKNPKVIVDVGCGTGLWAIEVAREFPSAQVHGLDISDIQPTNAPENTTWHKVNVCDGLPFEPSSVDFIQIRFLPSLSEPVIQLRERPTVMKYCLEALRPGGVLLLLELSEDRSPNGTLCPSKREFYDLRTSAVAKKPKEQLPAHGASARIGKLIRGMLEEVGGFRDIHWMTKDIPIGPWVDYGAGSTLVFRARMLKCLCHATPDERMKEIGAMQLRNSLLLFDSFAAGMKHELGLDPVLVDELCRKAKEEMQEPHRHVYWPYDFAWGFKI
ncbi:S-adenosyl-L-methionine-dependent methyltransferase [Atractiella rhizophila]|nr:S-adenosyl-L-methionine-dependent methyltransferase [Atractiella rhizophila]